jgi:hypothetical protein
MDKNPVVSLKVVRDFLVLDWVYNITTLWRET